MVVHVVVVIGRIVVVSFLTKIKKVLQMQWTCACHGVRENSGYDLVGHGLKGGA